MIFTDIDKRTVQALCTLAQLAGSASHTKDEIISVGQHLGVPKENTLELLEEFDENDTMALSSVEEKKSFVSYCFAFMKKGYHPDKSEVALYRQVVNRLGLETGSYN